MTPAPSAARTNAKFSNDRSDRMIGFLLQFTKDHGSGSAVSATVTSAVSATFESRFVVHASS
jgi:hypothetical protein